MSRRCCILCGKSRSMHVLRYASKRKQQTAILMHVFMVANSPPLQKIKNAFKECLEKNKRLCHVHYAEAAQYIASKLAEMDVQFSHYEDPTASGNTAYLNEGDIPNMLVDSLNDAVKIIDEKLTIRSRDIGQFMNRCLQQYFSAYESGKKLQPSSLAKLKSEELPFFKDDIVATEAELQIDLHDREVDITALLSTPCTGFVNSSENCDERSSSHPDKACTSDAGNEVLNRQFSQRCNGDSEDQKIVGLKLEANIDESSNDLTKLDETNPDFMQRIFMVQGRALLELFRFCPQCGCELQEKGGIQLIAKGTTPIVQYMCRFCSTQTSSLKLWEGRRKDETEDQEEKQ